MVQPTPTGLVTLHVDDDHEDDQDTIVGAQAVARRIEKAKTIKKDAEKRRVIDAKYSIERYRNLLDYFRDVQVLTPDTPTFLVEKVRNLAEFLVYGQKFNLQIYFEEFIEENVL